MLKGNCIHPKLNRVLSQTGHTDLLAIVDAGFPIASQPERIDLAWTKGKPSWEEVCRLIREEIVIEKIYIASELKQSNPENYNKFVGIFFDTDIELIAHEQLKEMSKATRAVIRTGEYSPFCNCVIKAGVAF